MAFIRGSGYSGDADISGVGVLQDKTSTVGKTKKSATIGAAGFSGPVFGPNNQNEFEDSIDSVPEFNSTQSLSNSANSLFGFSVSIGNGKFVVGAPFDTYNGNVRNGAVYIIDPNRDGSTFNELQFNNYRTGSAGVGFGYSSYIKIGRGDAGESPLADTYFGWEVAAGCGRVVVGAPNDPQGTTGAGAFYIFTAHGKYINKFLIPLSGVNPAYGSTNTSDTTRLNRYFGSSLAIGSGRIVAGSYNDATVATSAGAIYIYDLNGTLLRKVVPFDGNLDSRFGWDVSIGSGRIVVGAPGDDDNGSFSGAAYIYDLFGNFIRKIKPPTGQVGGQFGRTVCSRSERIVVGAPQESHDYKIVGSSFVPIANNGAAYVYGMSGRFITKLNPGTTSVMSGYTLNSAGIDNGEFGSSVAIGDNLIIIGQPFVPGSFVYNGSGALWKTDVNTTSPNTTQIGLGANQFVSPEENVQYGTSCAVGSGLMCVGGPGNLKLGVNEVVQPLGVSGRVKLGRSLGVSGASVGGSFGSELSYNFLTRTADLIDYLDNI